MSNGLRELAFGALNVHLPPLAHLGSSHLGSMPSCVRAAAGLSESEAASNAHGRGSRLEQVEVRAVDQLAGRHDVVVQAASVHEALQGVRVRAERESPLC